MNIVILGAGAIGASIAGMLCRLKYNVTVVDSSRSAPAQVEDSPIPLNLLRSPGLNNSLIAAFERSRYVRIPGADDKLLQGEIAVVLTQRGTASEQVIKLFESPS